jgi:hypothetical protein
MDGSEKLATQDEDKKKSRYSKICHSFFKKGNNLFQNFLLEFSFFVTISHPQINEITKGQNSYLKKNDSVSPSFQ